MSHMQISMWAHCQCHGALFHLQSIYTVGLIITSLCSVSCPDIQQNPRDGQVFYYHKVLLAYGELNASHSSLDSTRAVVLDNDL